MGDEDIGILIQPTFAIIVEHWSSFDAIRQSEAYTMISKLLKAHPIIVRKMVNHIPSLATIPLMSKFEEEIGKLRAQADTRHQLIAFGQRCQDENSAVVRRALIEMEVYLNEHQEFLHNTAVNEQPEPVVSHLIRALLDACVRFTVDGSDIVSLCARCVGLIGCLDYTKTEVTKEERVMLLLSNFADSDETVDFLMMFIRKVLVKVFLSASNSRSQGFLAYAMQDLLKFCHFDKTTIHRSRDMPCSSNYVRWMELPESVRNTLMPFLTSKYIVNSSVSQHEEEYPIYRRHLSHGQWIRTLTFDLLRKGTGENPKHIFPVFIKIVRLQDISISSFLLPHIVLNVAAGGTDLQRQCIRQEMLTILESPLQDAITDSSEALLACSQVC